MLVVLIMVVVVDGTLGGGGVGYRGVGVVGGHGGMRKYGGMW